MAQDIKSKIKKDAAEGGEFWASCRECKHEFTICRTPILLDKFIELCDTAKCNKCHGNQLNVGKANE